MSVWLLIDVAWCFRYGSPGPNGRRFLYFCAQRLALLSFHQKSSEFFFGPIPRSRRRGIGWRILSVCAPLRPRINNYVEAFLQCAWRGILMSVCFRSPQPTMRLLYRPMHWNHYRPMLATDGEVGISRYLPIDTSIVHRVMMSWQRYLWSPQPKTQVLQSRPNIPINILNDRPAVGEIFISSRVPIYSA